MMTCDKIKYCVSHRQTNVASSFIIAAFRSKLKISKNNERIAENQREQVFRYKERKGSVLLLVCQCVFGRAAKHILTIPRITEMSHLSLFDPVTHHNTYVHARQAFKPRILSGNTSKCNICILTNTRART